MDNPPVSNDDLKQIQEQLKSLGEKVGNKWIVPVVVAAITGIFVIVNTVVQVRIQSSTQKETVRQIKEEEAVGTFNGTERAQFNQKARELLEKIDTKFAAVCYFTPDKKAKGPDKTADALTDAIYDFRILRETAPSAIDKETQDKLKAYSEFVANNQLKILMGKISLDKTKEVLAQSKELRKAALEVLTKSAERKASS